MPQIVIPDEFEGFEKVYTDIKSPGCVWRHILAKETVDDYAEVYEIATDFAKIACTVKILPILDVTHPLRESIFKGAKDNKCPDLNVDGDFVDVKTPLADPSLNCIDNNVKKGAKQANHVVIRIAGELEYWKMEYVAKQRFGRHLDLHTIQFKIIGKKYYTFTRNSIK